MSWDTEAPADVIVSILAQIRGTGGEQVGAVQIGVPEGSGKQIFAYVTAGGQTPSQVRGGVASRTARYTIIMAYRLDGAEATAERKLMRLLDALEFALLNNRKLNGTCDDLEIDASLANAAEYSIYTGKEYREFPVTVTVRQEQIINPKA